ncbi:MAG: serine/threonine-protein kinase [Pirellulales bacterium]
MSHTAPGTAAAPAPDLSGREIGDYLLVRRLGQGAMAEVYLAEQQSLRRPVALKLLRADLAADESYVRRFRIEAQAAAALVHATIVQIYEVGCTAGTHYIAQEYVPGENLRERLRRKGPPSLGTSLHILRQVAAALTKAGERGIVHRDIKPDNILLADSGEVKVADFGLARVATGPSVELTQTGMTLGTPLYMSPEQVEGRPLDPRSDLYSFGVTSYHLLAGQPPFRGDTALSVAVQHLKNEPEPLELLRPDLPPRLAALVHRLLAKRPDDRPASAGEVAQELLQIELELGGRSTGSTGPRPAYFDANSSSDPRLAATSKLAALMRSEDHPVVRRRRWGAYAAALVAAALTGAALGSVFRAPPLLGSGPALEVEDLKSAIKQLHHASTIGQSESAWKAVVLYYPGTWQADAAEQRLAMLYLDREQWAQALPLLEKFSRRTDDDEVRALGLAGAYVALARLNRAAEADRYRSQLEPSLFDRLRVEMKGLVEETNRLGSSRGS